MTDLQRRRFTVLTGGILIAFAVFFARANYLIFFNDKIRSFPPRIHVKRGMILDKRGLELAVSIESATIGVDPKNVYDPEFTAKYLSEPLGIPIAKITESIRSKNSYFLLKREIDKNLGKSIQNLSLPGVRVEKEYKRVYPQGSLASGLLGFTGVDDDRALEGIENEFNMELMTPSNKTSEAGNNIYLTIDSVIQYRLEKSLKKVFESTRSRRAVGILMDARDGSILAMASFPNFDPNHFGKFPTFNHTNWAIRHVYEPGSTMKIFIALMLLNEEVLTIRERFYCPGYVEFGNSMIRCTDKHGHVSLYDILQSSCNVGIIKAAQKVSNKTYYKYLKKFGFGEKTQFSGAENVGYLPPLRNWNPNASHFFSIGQGLSVTPIQLVASAAAIVNGGTFYYPRAVDRIVDSSGRLVHQFQPKGVSLDLKPEARRILLEAMTRVVKSGTGKKAYLRDITIAGKTGTGQKAIPGRGYESGLWSASFLGFFPAEDPKIVGLILFDEPEGNIYTGGGLAAPVFGEVVEEILPVLDIGTRVQEYSLRKEVPPKKFRMSPELVPDLRGLTKVEAIAALRELNLRFTMEGSGFVKDQYPPAGTKIEDTILVRVIFDQ